MLVRRAKVLPLVPEHRVEDVWLEALEDNEDDDHDVQRFKDYGNMGRRATHPLES